jgi:multiple sugar transport system substrate-binding protein
MRARRNRLVSSAVVTVLALVVGGCGDDSGAGSDSGDERTVSIWVPWTGEDFADFENAIAAFEDANPGIDVEATPGVDNTTLLAAIAGDDAPDVVIPLLSYDLYRLCESGAAIDLGPRIEADGLEEVAFTGGGLDALAINGTRCALPYLADDFALYYNRDHFAEAGITQPPRTISELTDAAKRLSKIGSDGTIERAGFVPLIGFYQNYLDRFGEAFGFTYLDGERSTVASDTAVRAYYEWQRELVDFYGHDKLVEFTAGAGDEFSADHGFYQGRISMLLDGEWRTQFIEDEAAELDYGTAPFPVSDDHPELYGSGMIAPGIILVLEDASDQDTSWELAKFLATDVDAQVEFAGALNNLPTLAEAADHPDFDIDDQFRTFFDISEHPETGSAPLHETGILYLELMFRFTERWQAGEVGDLQEGLDQLAAEIDEQLAAG